VPPCKSKSPGLPCRTRGRGERVRSPIGVICYVCRGGVLDADRGLHRDINRRRRRSPGAQEHGEALKEAPAESYVTRDHLDRRLGEVEGRLEASIAAVDAKIDKRVAEPEMLRYMVTQTAAMAAIVFGLLRLLR
jgi:hypothetical protein